MAIRFSTSDSNQLNALLDKPNITAAEKIERDELLDAYDQAVNEANVYDQMWECGYLYEGMDMPYTRYR